ncbi:MAG: HAD-IA family hydrolase [Lentisphaeraceae bacterium]|nr:HAD-IA family hydrolase [Lentisphaeraceae bacterium]
MTFKAFIFDLDGTLVDSGADIANATNLMRQHYKLETIPLETVFSYIGNGAKKLVERAMVNTGIEVDDALKTFLEIYQENICLKSCFFDGIEEFLKELQKRNIPAVVLTNKPQAMTDKLLKEMKATSYFKLIYGPEAYGAKPSPIGLKNCIAQLGVEKSDVVMVGDHTTDLNAADSAGVKSIFCTFGLGVKDGCNPDFIISSGEELFKFV